MFFKRCKFGVLNSLFSGDSEITEFGKMFYIESQFEPKVTNNPPNFDDRK